MVMSTAPIAMRCRTGSGLTDYGECPAGPYFKSFAKGDKPHKTARLNRRSVSRYRRSRVFEVGSNAVRHGEGSITRAKTYALRIVLMVLPKGMCCRSMRWKPTGQSRAFLVTN